MGGRKQRPVLIVLTAVFILIISVGLASATIVGSKHDMSFLNSGANFSSTNEDEVCIFCHTPHGGISQDSSGNRVPLWNRSISQNETGFTPYSSPTLNATLGQPTGITLLCLSCHDGVSTLNTLINYGRFNPIVMDGGFDQIGDVWIGPGNPPGYPGANVGEGAAKNLANDHPVSFVFDAALISADAGGGPAKLQLPISSDPIKLFNNRLECATCHDPHEEGALAAGTFPFLRKSNQASGMCLTCHIK
ncbi:MAG TPA: hypothetical protein DCO77_05945 [Nitrospiraceae bacterium]|nr:hypothetical protein [Nitrospiraceae bacterium]